jgi:hypothetical protein
VADSSKHGNEDSSSIKYREFLDQLSDCQPRKKNSAASSLCGLC